MARGGMCIFKQETHRLFVSRLHIKSLPSVPSSKMDKLDICPLHRTHSNAWSFIELSSRAAGKTNYVHVSDPNV